MNSYDIISNDFLSFDKKKENLHLTIVMEVENYFISGLISFEVLLKL